VISVVKVSNVVKSAGIDADLKIEGTAEIRRDWSGAWAAHNSGVVTPAGSWKQAVEFLHRQWD